MRTDKTLVLIRREYLSRIRTKGFWIGTVILPLFMAAVFVLPSLFLSKQKTKSRLVVVDETGTVGAALVERLATRGAGEDASAPTPAQPPGSEPGVTGRAAVRAEVVKRATFDATLVERRGDRAAQRAALDKRVLAGEIDAWLWLDESGLKDNHVEYHGQSVSNFLTQERLERTISEVVREARLKAAGYDASKITELTRPIDLKTTHVAEGGGRAEAGFAGAAMAYFLYFLLYMVLAIYGQQVLTGVLEEKSSRVVELIISTVTPFELMMGKLIGIGLVGLTQLAIWLTTAAVLTAPGIVAAIAWMPKEGLPSLSPGVVLNFLILFVLGFFLFATFYAAIGSAFNDIREAQQASSAAMFFLVPPMLLFPVVINDPDSTMAVVLSLVPFFTPLLMLLRIAVKMPPLWQILLAYALTGGAVMGMLRVCAKIYRVGILMYGKKPTFKDLWQWVRYAS